MPQWPGSGQGRGWGAQRSLFSWHGNDSRFASLQRYQGPCLANSKTVGPIPWLGTTHSAEQLVSMDRALGTRDFGRKSMAQLGSAWHWVQHQTKSFLILSVQPDEVLRVWISQKLSMQEKSGEMLDQGLSSWACCSCVGFNAMASTML